MDGICNTLKNAKLAVVRIMNCLPCLHVYSHPILVGIIVFSRNQHVLIESSRNQHVLVEINMCLATRKPVFRVSDKARFKSVSSVIGTS